MRCPRCQQEHSSQARLCTACGAGPGARTKSRRARAVPVSHKPPKSEGGGARDLENRLAEAVGRVQGLNRQLIEAQEQQTATSDILRVISRSQTDVQPVFDTIVESAAQLCGGLFSGLYRFDGEFLHPGAQYNFGAEGLEQMHRIFPARPTHALGTGRAILECAVVHIPDVEVDPEYRHHGLTRAIGLRSAVFVPLLRDGAPLGVIMVARAEPGPFPESQIELLKTFAEQTVIAVENVRLFTELQASNRELTTTLETQTATSDILRVINRSPASVQPVFDAIVGTAVRRLRGYT